MENELKTYIIIAEPEQRVGEALYWGEHGEKVTRAAAKRFYSEEEIEQYVAQHGIELDGVHNFLVPD